MSDPDTSTRASLPDLAHLLDTEAALLAGWAKLARSPTLPIDLAAEIKAVGGVVTRLQAAAGRIRIAYDLMCTATAVIDPVRPDGTRWGAGQPRPVPTTGELISGDRGAMSRISGPGPESYAALMAWPNPDLIDWTSDAP